MTEQQKAALRFLSEHGTLRTSNVTSSDVALNGVAAANLVANGWARYVGPQQVTITNAGYVALSEWTRYGYSIAEPALFSDVTLPTIDHSVPEPGLPFSDAQLLGARTVADDLTGAHIIPADPVQAKQAFRQAERDRRVGMLLYRLIEDLEMRNSSDASEDAR